MNFAAVIKAFDTFMALRDAAKRISGGSQPPPSSEGGLPATTPGAGVAGQIEARLTNVVVAALKEAFDRDHARLEIERAQIEEQRRRAEEAMRLELRRQAVDREIARLRLLAGTALVGWVASVVMLVARVGDASVVSRGVMALGWALLLGALAAAFTAQGRVSANPGGAQEAGTGGPAATAALWLLTAGLGATAISLLF